MFSINHNDAITIEHIVTNLYGYDRAGIAGLANADIFADKPIYAGILVVAYLYAKGLSLDDKELSSFLNKYQVIFDYPDENDATREVQNYIEDLKEIVEEYHQ